MRNESVYLTNHMGENVEALWTYLAKHPGAKPSEIKRGLNLRDDHLWMTIGLLAGFGKIIFSENGKTVRISIASK